MRLPKPRERCPVTGLSRTSLAEILDEIDPATQEPYVRQMRVERHGKQRRIRLIHKQSLLDYLNQRASRQSLSFAPHVNNPDNLSVEDVISSSELFQYFIGDDNQISDEAWEFGRLSTRKQRLQVLLEKGILVLPQKVQTGD